MGVLPGSADIGPPGKVIHHIRADLGEKAFPPWSVEEIGAGDRVDPYYLIAVSIQVFDQIGPYEPRRASDNCSHGL
jgi:hypothetical protein